MKAWILNVGDEVVCGKVVNTNASFLARKLASVGVEIDKIIVVKDDKNAICEEIINFKKSNIDILVTTGGLGPTHDDFTKEVICEQLNIPLVEKKEVLDNLNKYFNNEYSKENLKQCFYPKDSYLLDNKVGTAPGVVFNYENRMCIMLVGPPYEMTLMVDNELIPYLKDKIKIDVISCDFMLCGKGESELESEIMELNNKYPMLIINPYVGIGYLRYQINSCKRYEADFNECKKEFELKFREYIFSNVEDSLENILVNILIKKRMKIAIAESCTGGMLTSKIINVPSASKVIDLGIISYSNKMKNKLLDVSNTLLKTVGAVSSEVVKSMVQGLKKQVDANIYIGVSGIAGPNSENSKKVVGLVYFCLEIDKVEYIEEKIFKGSRNLIREKSCNYILYRIIKLLS